MQERTETVSAYEHRPAMSVVITRNTLHTWVLVPRRVRVRYLSRRLSLNATPLTGSDSRVSSQAGADVRTPADGPRRSQAVVWDSVRELSGRGLHGSARDRGLLRLRELTRLRADARLLKMLELSPRQTAPPSPLEAGSFDAPPGSAPQPQLAPASRPARRGSRRHARRAPRWPDQDAC